MHSSMKWPAYASFAYLMLGLQVGASRYLAIRGAAPNFGLIAMLFIAFHARKESAMLGCLIVGLTQDFLSGGQPGLYALSYGLSAALLVPSQHTIRRSHWLTHVLVAMIAGFITMTVILLHSWFHPAGISIGQEGLKSKAIRIPAAVEFTRVLYTAALTPLVLNVANRVRHFVGATILGRRM